MIVIGKASFGRWKVERFDSLSRAAAGVYTSLVCKPVKCFCVTIDACVLPLDFVEFESATRENFHHFREIGLFAALRVEIFEAKNRTTTFSSGKEPRDQGGIHCPEMSGARS